MDLEQKTELSEYRVEVVVVLLALERRRTHLAIHE